MRLSSVSIRGIAIITGAVLLLGSEPAAADPVDYSETPVNGWDVDGTVYAVEISGNTVYVGGQFSNARSPSGATVPRRNLAAFNRTTGALLSFRADANSTVRAIDFNGTNLYVGGGFTTIGGVARNRVAALNPTSGSVVTTFDANSNGLVYALESSGSNLFVGGAFSSIGGASQSRLASVSTASGTARATFAADPDNTVRGLAVAGTRLWVGGQFTSIGGSSRRYVAAVNTTTGTAEGPNLNSTATGRAFAVDVTPDGTTVFAALGDGANRAVAWNASSGSRRWRQVAMGDVQAVRYVDGNLFFGFHEGFNDDLTVRMLAADALTGTLEDFSPSINSFYGVWAIDATSEAIVAGGEFTSVSGVATGKVAIFS
ncbi:MAG: hypothetical protein ACRCYQ_05820 [Nocardioides sp.]